MDRHNVARILSEVFAPWVSNVVFFMVLGAVTGQWAAGVAGALGTGVLPMAAILTFMRMGKVGDHHVTRREERLLVLGMITAIVIMLLIGLVLWQVDELLINGVICAIAFLLVFAVVTVAFKIKASIHVGLWVCLTAFLVATVSAWFALALVATPAIAWARYVIKHHSVFELCVGVISGLLVGVAAGAILL